MCIWLLMFLTLSSTLIFYQQTLLTDFEQQLRELRLMQTLDAATKFSSVN